MVVKLLALDMKLKFVIFKDFYLYKLLYIAVTNNERNEHFVHILVKMNEIYICIF